MSAEMPAREIARFEFDFEPPRPVATTPRTRAVAAEFRLGDPSSRRLPGRASTAPEAMTAAPRRRPRLPIGPPAPGELMLIVGASGSGKSSLLRRLRARATRRGTHVIDLRRIPLPRDRPTLDAFDDAVTIDDALRRLARVGLAEVWTWLRPPSQLSEGQRWRLRVALALRRAERAAAAGRPTLILCDEFAAVLDRITAQVVALTLARAVARSSPAGDPTLAADSGFAAIVATSHDDLAVPLAPTTLVRCDFGRVTLERGVPGVCRADDAQHSNAARRHTARDGPQTTHG